MNVDIISPGSDAQEVKTALGQSHAVRSGGGWKRGNGRERQGDNDCDRHRGRMSAAIDDGRAGRATPPGTMAVVGRPPVEACAARSSRVHHVVRRRCVPRTLGTNVGPHVVLAALRPARMSRCSLCSQGADVQKRVRSSSGGQGVAGSNPVVPTGRRRSVEQHQRWSTGLCHAAACSSPELRASALGTRWGPRRPEVGAE
jgi:hypothetical protein